AKSEVELISKMSEAHQQDFAAFSVEFDHFGSTNSPANQALCGAFWTALRASDLIIEEDVTQLFDVKEGTFLADRFVKGTCPRCGEPNQYGDNCDKCSATYAPTELLNPISALSGTVPEIRRAPHLFVELEKEHEFLAEWTRTPGTLQPEVANYLHSFFLGKPLRNWDVSRPAPYFGFEIPTHPGNYWYVWFDAPIGYLATTQEWCDKHGDNLDRWWRSPETEIYHFIGKDIVYFHTLFWPAMLKAAGFNLPKRVQVHGFLTANGEKMSKSKGARISASAYLEHLDPAYLRYYYASKLGSGIEDIDLDLEEFAQRVNSELLNKVINLASRTARFVEGTGLASVYPEDEGLFAAAAKTAEEIADAYDAFDFARAMRLTMALADKANEYVARMAPWALKKDPTKAQEVQDVCTVSLNLFRQLMVFLAPVLPKLAEQAAALLGASIARWEDAQAPLVGTPIGKYEHLMQKVEASAVLALAAANEEKAAPAETAPSGAEEVSDDDAALIAEPLGATCTFDDFAKIDLRVARVLKAEELPKAKKLLKLTLSLGGDHTRTVFAGIKAAYSADDLVGRLVVMVANLAPREMTFGTSEGMVIAAGPGAEEVFLLSPDSGAKPGQRVH
ncbi:MAG: Methionine--tRNA ligase, partial [Pseudomonadota bacterium]